MRPFHSLARAVRRAWTSPILRAGAVALAAGLLLALVPADAFAQSGGAINEGSRFMDRLIPLLGKAMVVVGILLIIVGGWGVKEQRGGWPAIIVGVFLIFGGVRLSSGSTTDDARNILTLAPPPAAEVVQTVA